MREKWLLLLMVVMLVGQAHAYTGFGICNYGNEIVSSVICYGPAVLKGTTVLGNMKVAGPLKTMNVITGSVSIAGSADMQNTKIKGSADITGRLTANGVNFQQGLVIAADNILLSHTTIIGSVTITSQTNRAYLKMQCGSTISDSVTFEGMAGVVQITDDSVIQGKVINGSMEFVKVKC